MTDERDPKLSAAYRELGAEEPPRALDDAILAAARREAGARPGSPGRASPQRWYAPLAAAAVLVLALAVTLHMEYEQPDIAQPVPAAKQPAAPPEAARSTAETAEELKLRVERELKSPASDRAGVIRDLLKEPAKEAAKPESPKSVASPRPSAPEPFPAERMADATAARPAARAAPAPAPSVVLSPRADQALGSASSVVGAGASRAEERVARDAEAAARAPQAGPVQALAKRSAAQAEMQAETPERELERIADLRRQGRHDEADKALAEFRKRHPDYAISEAMRERVERR